MSIANWTRKAWLAQELLGNDVGVADQTVGIGHKMELPDFATGWCAANHSSTHVYNGVDCDPIRSNVIDAMADRIRRGYESVRYVHWDGFLYVDKP
jgi:hypothetical protein